MTLFDRRPGLRWLLPLVAALVLAGAGSAIGVISASARSGLPPRGAAKLLVDVQQARVAGLSGTVVQTSNLGLPSLPGIGGSGSSDLSSLVSGSHTLRVWYADPQHVRLALLGSLGESDVVRNGSDLWTWASKNRTAGHWNLPAGSSSGDKTVVPQGPTTPQQAADAALKAITPSTTVTTNGTAVVAGRSAYELVLQPRDPASLVDSVHIAVDGKTHIPIRVQVFAKGMSSPAFEVGFTSFDPTTPSASVFAFNPPPSTKVTDHGALQPPGEHASGSSSEPSTKAGTKPDAGPAPSVVGSGWTTVVVTKAPTSGSAAAPSGAGPFTEALRSLPTVSGSWGSGRLLQGTLFSAVLTDDGRLAIGAVPPHALYAALARR
jgi:outer membrane lipoprotein-sorting protein